MTNAQAFREAMAELSREIEWDGRDSLAQPYASLCEAAAGLLTEAERVGPLCDALQTAILELDECKQRIETVMAAIARVGGKRDS